MHRMYLVSALPWKHASLIVMMIVILAMVMMARAMSTSVMRVHSCLSSTTLRRIVESLI